ncbi:MAG TPA: nuclear transport factor 2 family protein [Candidatus Acidoferrales bacterium]|nr:nuclear transport factor 2 family protein [Candidatus Acidoferrales bacterium]
MPDSHPNPPRIAASVLVALLFAFAVAPCLAQTDAPRASSAAAASAAQGIRDATMRFYIALNSVLRGDLGPMETVWSRGAEVSNLSPAGDRARGWNAVFAYYKNLSRQSVGGRIAPTDITVVAGINLGYSVCIEEGETRSPEGPMVKYSQRVTNIFRLEDGKWKLIHHHADANSGGVQSIQR